jgi:hypothetical protein
MKRVFLFLLIIILVTGCTIYEPDDPDDPIRARVDAFIESLNQEIRTNTYKNFSPAVECYEFLKDPWYWEYNTPFQSAKIIIAVEEFFMYEDFTYIALSSRNGVNDFGLCRLKLNSEYLITRLEIYNFIIK